MAWLGVARRGKARFFKTSEKVGIKSTVINRRDTDERNVLIGYANSPGDLTKPVSMARLLRDCGRRRLDGSVLSVEVVRQELGGLQAALENMTPSLVIQERNKRRKHNGNY